MVEPRLEQAAEEGGGVVVKGWQALADALDWYSCGCHSRLAGMYVINHWIPAYAGMTTGAEVK